MAEMMKLEEKLSFSLRELYQSYGYDRFKMSKFEPYDFYLQNKEYLDSDGIITFTDTDGTLMALKPDVTLSIVKKYRPGAQAVQRVCYSENVYRVAGASKTYREQMQTGLECLGDIGLYELSEVLLLALKSLNRISKHFVLNLSDIDIVTGILNGANLTEAEMAQAIKCMEQKNENELRAIPGLEEQTADQLALLLNAGGNLWQVMKNLPPFITEEAAAKLKKLSILIDNLGFSNFVNLDFSIVSNRNYYNGLVFRGYVEGLPSEVLAGGQYDRLMEKMGKPARGVGFAVYLDQLELLERRKTEQKADVVLLYQDKDDLTELHRIRALFSEERMLILRKLPDHLKYKKLLKLENGRVMELEDND